MFENKSRLWVIHISNHKDMAMRAQREGFVCIGWTAVGDPTTLDTREKMKAAFHRTFPDSSSATINASYGQVFRFAHEMRIGDPVVYPIKGSQEIMIGEVSGNYRWAADDEELRSRDYCNVRPVTWLKTVPRIAFSQAALHSFGSFSSVSTSDEFLDEVTSVLKGEKAAPRPSAPIVSSESVLDFPNAEQINLADQAVQETQDYLLRQWSRTKQDFEEVVAAVFRAMGYTAHTQAGNHDLGVDVVAHSDPLGVKPPLLKIQAKSGTGTTGAPAVKQLRGLLNNGEKGVMVALGGFSNDAQHVQQNDGDLVLIDGDRFVELFLEFYENLEPEMRNRFPLRRVYVAVR